MPGTVCVYEWEIPVGLIISTWIFFFFFNILIELDLEIILRPKYIIIMNLHFHLATTTITKETIDHFARGKKVNYAWFGFKCFGTMFFTFLLFFFIQLWDYIKTKIYHGFSLPLLVPLLLQYYQRSYKSICNSVTIML